MLYGCLYPSGRGETYVIPIGARTQNHKKHFFFKIKIPGLDRFKATKQFLLIWLTQVGCLLGLETLNEKFSEKKYS